MKLIILPLLFLTAAIANAQNFWVPAEKFNNHSDSAPEGTLIVDDVIGKSVYLLGNDQQVRIKIGFDNDLTQYLEQYSVFEVCAFAANYDTNVVNTVRSKHPDHNNSQDHTLRANSYKLLCSKQASISPNNLQTAGIKIISPSQGVVKVRGLSFRGIEATETLGDFSLLEGYEYSRALGYLWGDGRLSTDASLLTFIKRKSSTSMHFGSVAGSFFANALTENSQGTRYRLDLDGVKPADFLAEGIRLSDIPDPRAFLTSVIETEGAVLVGRLTDDPSRERCNYIKTLVDSLNPQCAADTCTGSSCATPNCAFVAHGGRRGTPDRPGVNSHCGVYLSGNTSDWKALFSNDNYHFVKTDRTPGGEPVQHDSESRPAYTQ